MGENVNMNVIKYRDGLLCKAVEPPAQEVFKDR